jgi:hypothetical protein
VKDVIKVCPIFRGGAYWPQLDCLKGNYLYSLENAGARRCREYTFQAEWEIQPGMIS